MSELKLLPCPFCGGEAILSPDGDFATCNSEFCTVWVRAKRWNTRTDDKRIAELESDKRILMRETAQVRTNNVNNLKWIADLQAQVDALNSPVLKSEWQELQAQLDKVRGVKQYDGHIYDNRLRVPTVVVRYDDLQQALQEKDDG